MGVADLLMSKMSMYVNYIQNQKFSLYIIIIWPSDFDLWQGNRNVFKIKPNEPVHEISNMT